MNKYLIVALLFLGIVSCTEKSDKTSSTEKEEVITEKNYQELGNNITNTSQKTLLTHVGSAMKMGGPLAAIQYCNINAMTITDSLSKAFDVRISRVTDKNRNSANVLKNEDLTIWKHYNSGEINIQMGDTVVAIEGKNVYYKPIYIANPVCLNCHGQSGTDIMDFTLAKIEEFYPEDLAKEYNLGELRGLWKVEFKK